MQYVGAILIACIHFLINILLCPILLNFRLPLGGIGSLTELRGGQLNRVAVLAPFSSFVVASSFLLATNALRQHSPYIPCP